MFKAAFYETEITPPLDTLVAGHYSKTHSKDIAERLYTKAVVIDNGVETVAVVCLDAEELAPDLHKNVVQRVGDFTGIKPQNITVCCNHTHEGGPVKAYPELGELGDASYIDIITRLSADCITLAYRRLEPVNIKYGCGEVYGIAFNRDFVMRDGSISTNTGRGNFEITEESIPPEIPVVKIEDAQKSPGAKIINPNCVGNLAGIDPSLPVLVFERADGSLMGAMINFACHQTAGCVLGSGFTSGDFSSELSRQLKNHYGSDFVSLFILGTCGDINHINPCVSQDPPDIYKKMGRRLAEEAIGVISAAEPICGSELIARKELITVNKRTADFKAVEREINRYLMNDEHHIMTLRNVVKYQGFHGSETEDLYIQCIRIGDVYFYALPGEIYVNFGLDIKHRSPSAKNIISEFANGIYNGYVPTREAFLPQSILYEAALCDGSCLEPEAGYIIADKAIELATQIKNEN